MNFKQTVFVLFMNLVILTGCGGVNYKEKLAAVRANMSKDELMLIMKEPGVVKSSAVGKNGKLTELWEYTIVVNIIEGDAVRFYFQFADDRLVKWGKR